MKYIFAVFLLISSILSSQVLELKEKSLITYYQSIINAENKIIDNELSEADRLYKIAFESNNRPPAKDIYNSMQVALKLKEYRSAFEKFNKLKCLGYPFDDKFKNKNFANIKYNEYKCDINFDYNYKKTLDSLYLIDQDYRNKSEGNYKKFQKEITKSDSIASVSILRLIQQKGFPNEYDIGISRNGDISFQNFYLIIWHQLASNKYSTQKVNFSNELNIALNKGKISPENAAFLYDLNNNSSSFSSLHFNIIEFITSNGSSKSIRQQILDKTFKSDCCYVHVWFDPKQRNEKAIEMVRKIDDNRKKIGLSDLDSELNKKVFYIKNKDYIFPRMGVLGEAVEEISKVEFLKKSLIKLP